MKFKESFSEIQKRFLRPDANLFQENKKFSNLDIIVTTVKWTNTNK